MKHCDCFLNLDKAVEKSDPTSIDKGFARVETPGDEGGQVDLYRVRVDSQLILFLQLRS